MADKLATLSQLKNALQRIRARIEQVELTPGPQGPSGFSVKKINTYSRDISMATWKKYGEIGHIEPWLCDGYDNADMRIGDIGCITGTVNDAFDASGDKIQAAIYGKVTAITSRQITMETIHLMMGYAGPAGPAGNANVTYSTTDPGAGSPLKEGQVYLVYE